ncbi:hypothetical protein A2U01_0064396, partial [Trifolium medium]|nr:hypothetical protein [Trifolium medium]
HHSSKTATNQNLNFCSGTKRMTLKPPERRKRGANRQPPTVVVPIEPDLNQKVTNPRNPKRTDPDMVDTEGQRHSSHHRHRMSTSST